jgi:hypothetical protein
MLQNYYFRADVPVVEKLLAISKTIVIAEGDEMMTGH